MMPLWAVFGYLDLVGLEQDIPWSSPILWLYALISGVVLVNLLVAMFADTYTRVLSASEMEYRYQKATLPTPQSTRAHAPAE